jgi:fused signal recognition particle receptor
MNLDPDFVSALVTTALVLAGSASAVAVARRARARRRAEIDAVPETERAVDASKTLDAEPARAPGRPELPPGGGAARPEPRREGAQIIPFLPPEPPAPAPIRREPSPLLPGLARTRSGWIAKLGSLFAGRKQIDPELIGEIERVLLTADIGVKTSMKLLEELRASLTRKDLQDADAMWSFLRSRCKELLTVGKPGLDLAAARPFVLLVIGVNGSGKTTSIGKLAAQLRASGKSVLLAAGDTFRAAAVEQLEIWGRRVDVPVVKGKEGADPSSVIFDAVKRAQADGVDVVIADTAGRLHTKADLMEELQKVRRVIGKACEGAPHETWLVIDSTSGQNAINQAQIFTQAMQVTGIVLTKLDGTAKGGVIIGIVDQLGIPVRYIGVGEKVEDLRPFDAEEFADALFGPAPEAASALTS